VVDTGGGGRVGVETGTGGGGGGGRGGGGADPNSGYGTRPFYLDASINGRVKRLLLPAQKPLQLEKF